MAKKSMFTERLSLFMVIIAALGGFLVLLDPRVQFPVYQGYSLSIGGEGFSADLKGAVVSLILIGGWTAVKEYWLGSSSGSDKKTDTIQQMSAAVASVTGTGSGNSGGLKVDNVDIDSKNVNLHGDINETNGSKK